MPMTGNIIPISGYRNPNLHNSVHFVAACVESVDESVSNSRVPHLGDTLKRLAEAARIPTTTEFERRSGLSRKSIELAYEQKIIRMRPDNLDRVLQIVGSDQDQLILKAAVDWDPIGEEEKAKSSTARLRILECIMDLEGDRLYDLEHHANALTREPPLPSPQSYA